MGVFRNNVIYKLYGILRTNPNVSNTFFNNISEISKELLVEIAMNDNIAILTNPNLKEKMTERSINEIKKDKYKENYNACKNNDHYDKIDITSKKEEENIESYDESRIKKAF